MRRRAAIVCLLMAGGVFAPALSAQTPIKVFLVALEDMGKSGKKIGCEDSVVAVTRTIPATSAPLGAAIRELLSIRNRNYGQSGLYNALYQSTLKLDRGAVTAGKADIRLSGTLTVGGACDHPRVEAQIRETALQFPTVKSVAIFINGMPLDTQR